jgi:hemerythrin
MTFMTWNDKLSVGVAKIDEDHKILVGLLNELFEGFGAGHGKEVLGGILVELADYTVYHTALEESFFIQTGYPDAAAHQIEHVAMAAWVADVRRQFNDGTLAAPTLEVMNYLKDWLFDHILGSDQKFALYLQATGQLESLVYDDLHDTQSGEPASRNGGGARLYLADV